MDGQAYSQGGFLFLDKIMKNQSTLMMWVGLMMMILSAATLLLAWIHIEYQIEQYALGLLVFGIFVGVIGGIFWFIGASRGEN